LLATSTPHGIQEELIFKNFRQLSVCFVRGCLLTQSVLFHVDDVESPLLAGGGGSIFALPSLLTSSFEVAKNQKLFFRVMGGLKNPPVPGAEFAATAMDSVFSTRILNPLIFMWLYRSISALARCISEVPSLLVSWKKHELELSSKLRMGRSVSSSDEVVTEVYAVVVRQRLTLRLYLLEMRLFWYLMVSIGVCML